MTTGTPPRFTQLSQWSPAIDPRNGEDGPPTNQVAHRTPFYPLVTHDIHIGPREYASPTPTRHHNPFPLFH